MVAEPGSVKSVSIQGAEKAFNKMSGGSSPGLNTEKYVKELSKVCWDTFRATGAMFEQEHLRFIKMFAATGGNGSGGGATKHTRGIMENKVITN